MKIRGYTLIEILIALLVFSILGVITASVLSNTFNTESNTKKVARELTRLQLALSLIKQDLSQIVDRPISIAMVDFYPAVYGNQESVSFTRGGIIYPKNNKKLSSLNRVGYKLESGKLIRETWLQLDIPKESDPIEQVVLSRITKLKIEYYDKSNQRIDNWERGELPRAIGLTLTHQYFGQIPILVMLPQTLMIESKQNDYA